MAETIKDLPKEDIQNQDKKMPAPSKPAAKTAEAESNAAHNVKGKPKQASSGLKTFFLALLFMLLAASIGFVAYQQWLGQSQHHLFAQENEQLASELAEQARVVISLQASVPSMGENIQGFGEKLEILANNSQQSMAQLQQRSGDLQALQQALADTQKKLSAISTTSREDWKFAEAEYLLRLANQQLLMGKDVVAATALLTTVDLILQNMRADMGGDITVFPVREALALDLATLRAINRVDVEGIYLRLSALAWQTTDLNLSLLMREAFLQKRVQKRVHKRGQQSERLQASARQGFSQEISSYIESSVEKLKSYFVVRQRGGAVEALLPPQQEYYVKQNLRLMLEQSQLALLRGQQKIYRQSLEDAQRWMAQYFGSDESSVLAISQSLNELVALNIVQETADISTSLKAMQEYIKQSHQAPIDKPKADSPKADKPQASQPPLN